ncbi:hypothetical protein O181_121604 [Austropuccinia psidii MF-1]|uniref:Uncharacterized protein n=1 Tax=Austropuccinia psidii MF-1 TaxID=1389203 RepID=A0A9Q3KLF2_9BASI|nr:hypothetical protein [Austropuccinia psidii MF-1]
MTRTTFRGPGEDGEEEDKNCVEEEGSDGTEAAPAPVGASKGPRGPTLAQTEPSLLAIMQKMTQIMANLQASSSSEASRPPAFKTPSMKAPELSACDSKPEHKHESQNTINQWYSQDTTKTWI